MRKDFNWQRWTLRDEDTPPSVPTFDDEANGVGVEDQYVMGLALDLTGTEQVGLIAGEERFPPAPVVWALTSHGSLIAWTVLHKSAKPPGGATSYPFMRQAEALPTLSSITAVVPAPSPAANFGAPPVAGSSTMATVDVAAQAPAPAAPPAPAPTPTCAVAPASAGGPFTSAQLTNLSSQAKTPMTRIAKDLFERVKGAKRADSNSHMAQQDAADPVEEAVNPVVQIIEQLGKDAALCTENAALCHKMIDRYRATEHRGSNLTSSEQDAAKLSSEVKSLRLRTDGLHQGMERLERLRESVLEPSVSLLREPEPDSEAMYRLCLVPLLPEEMQKLEATAQQLEHGLHRLQLRIAAATSREPQEVVQATLRKHADFLRTQQIAVRELQRRSVAMLQQANAAPKDSKKSLAPSTPSEDRHAPAPSASLAASKRNRLDTLRRMLRVRDMEPSADIKVTPEMGQDGIIPFEVQLNRTRVQLKAPLDASSQAACNPGDMHRSASDRRRLEEASKVAVATSGLPTSSSTQSTKASFTSNAPPPPVPTCASAGEGITASSSAAPPPKQSRQSVAAAPTVVWQQPAASPSLSPTRKTQPKSEGDRLKLAQPTTVCFGAGAGAPAAAFPPAASQHTTPLFAAADGSKLTGLIATRAPPFSPAPTATLEQLHAAVKDMNKLADVKAILTSSPNLVNMADDKGITALIWAASKGHGEIARALLTAGADKTAVTKKGNDALKAAHDAKEKAHDPKFDDVIRALTEAPMSSSTPAASEAGGPISAGASLGARPCAGGFPSAASSAFGGLGFGATPAGTASGSLFAPNYGASALSQNFGGKTSTASQNSGVFSGVPTGDAAIASSNLSQNSGVLGGVPAASAYGCGSALSVFGSAASGGLATPTNGARTAWGSQTPAGETTLGPVTSTTFGTAFGQTSASTTAFAQPSGMGVSTPAFGQTSGMGVGTPAFGHTSGMGVGTPAFGHTSGMGVNTPAFRQSSGMGVSTPAFGQTSAMGASTPAFGLTSGIGAPAFSGVFSSGGAPAFAPAAAPAFAAVANATFTGFGALAASAASPGVGFGAFAAPAAFTRAPAPGYPAFGAPRV
jgi:hypothetical protein